MSILDKFRGSARKAKQQAEHVVEQHGDTIASGIEKTGEAVSKVTGHRFDDKIDKGVSKAKERLDGSADDRGPAPETTPPGTDTTPGDPGPDPEKGATS